METEGKDVFSLRGVEVEGVAITTGFFNLAAGVWGTLGFFDTCVVTADWTTGEEERKNE